MPADRFPAGERRTSEPPWQVHDARRASDEIRMLLAEAGRPDLADSLVSALIGPVGSLLIWDLAPGSRVEPVVHRAVDLYRQRTWHGRVCRRT